MDITALLKDLPLLINFDNDINSWLKEFQNVMNLYNINKQERQFVYLKQCVEEEIKSVLNNLIKKNNREYPTLHEIKIAIENYLDIKPSDKCWKLKSLKIKCEETIKQFNFKYLEKYQELDENYKKLISVDDYIEAIKTRIYPCMLVLEKECQNLEDAMKHSERAERIEKRLNITNNLGEYKQINKNLITNNQNIPNKIYNLEKHKKKIMCFKCYELGHKVESCLYSYKELAILEEHGILAENKNKNYDINYKYKNKKNSNGINSIKLNKLIKFNKNKIRNLNNGFQNKIQNNYDFNFIKKNKHVKYPNDNVDYKYSNHNSSRKIIYITPVGINTRNRNNYFKYNKYQKRNNNSFDIYAKKNINNNIAYNSATVENSNGNLQQENYNNIINNDDKYKHGNENMETSSNPSESDSQHTLITVENNLNIHESTTEDIIKNNANNENNNIKTSESNNFVSLKENNFNCNFNQFNTISKPIYSTEIKEDNNRNNKAYSINKRKNKRSYTRLQGTKSYLKWGHSDT